MTSFDDTRTLLRTARAERVEIDARARRAAEAKKRLVREIERLRRGANDTSGAALQARIEALQSEVAAAEADVRRISAELEEALGREFELGDRFEPFTDPTRAIENLPDSHPFLLFPVRIETRFATSPTGAPQLWVRVFPDDVLIDTFDPDMAEVELANTRLYWINTWRAGGDDAARRDAWRSLAKSHGSGRARWLLDQYGPLNPADEPVKNDTDHVLVIVPEQPVPAADKPAITAYWAATWQVGAADAAAARTALDTAVGAVRAAEIIEMTVPTNLNDTAVTRTDETTVVVAYLDLPPVASVAARELTWSRAATAWLLPERLVLMGFSGTDQTLSAVGRRIPAELQVGPDPLQDDADALAASGDDLNVPAGLKWTVDFDEAVRVGMGFRVDLTDGLAADGFDRLFVMGVRLGSDAEEGAGEIEALISHHQSSRKGFSLLPQGRPTNNTDDDAAGYTWWENPDESYDHFFVQDHTDDPADWQRRSDGRWLASLMGVDRDVLKRSPHYFGSDLAEARAMNIALWPATLGYFLEHMMAPMVGDETISATREFFNRFVVGTGLAPAVRIGRQPYGILPTTAFSRMRWLTDLQSHEDFEHSLNGLSLLPELQSLIDAAGRLWEDLSREVAFVGMDSDEPQQRLLDIVGLHPASVEFYQRYAETFDELYNRLSYSLISIHADAHAIAQDYVDTGLQVLADLGLTLPGDGVYPAILDKIFLLAANLLDGDIVAPPPVSDVAGLGVRRADGHNYLEWLVEAARTSHDTLRRQEGFDDAKPPTELLYLMLHHALDLGFVDTGVDLMSRSDVFGPDDLAVLKVEPRFIHVEEPDADPGSRWQHLYRPAESITGDPRMLLGDFIPQAILGLDSYLDQQLQAVASLADVASAALERAFVAHLDCCSYRLDAWRNGLLGAQLALMRADSGSDDDADALDARRGVLVGVYGWLEDVRPKAEERTPVELDAELADVFERPGDAPLMRDSSNLGHIHAPSLDHAVTAAILRNGYLANATPENPDSLAVNLASERVRTAMKLVEGIRNGQSLGALLGYQFERSLHDADDLFLDRLIFEFRKLFPLAGNRLTPTATADPNVPISAIEARNVVDGLALVEHFDAPSVATTYPFDLNGLPDLADLAVATSLTAAELGAVIEARIERIRALNDAVADLATAEGVYQVVRGNYERAAGTLEAFSKGNYPPTPDVAATPRSGRALTHRIGWHFQAGLDPTDPAFSTPRAQGEPSLNTWLTTALPPMASVFASVEHTDPGTGNVVSQKVSMTELGLLAIDVFYLVDSASERALPGLDELLVHHARRENPTLRNDTQYRPVYRFDAGSGVSVFEVAPLVRALRGVVLGSRPLRPTDVMLSNEASASVETQTSVRVDKAVTVRASLDASAGPLRVLVAELEAAVGESASDAAAEASALANIDLWTTRYSDAVHSLRLFGLPPVDLTLAIDRTTPYIEALASSLDEIDVRWRDKLVQFDAVIAEYNALTPPASDEERFALLIRAGRIVSTTVIAPLPPTPTDMLAVVQALRADLATALVDVNGLLGGLVRLGEVFSAVDGFAPRVAAFDLDPLDLGTYPSAITSIARDLLRAGASAVADIESRLAAAQAKLDELPATEPAAQADLVLGAARAVLGEAFVVLPEFVLNADQIAEWENAWGDRAAILDHLTSGPGATPFPVDDWLHGLARVRPKLAHVERAVLLADALGVAGDLELAPLQFPYRADAVWLGGRFPETMRGTMEPFRLEGDHLLYTAHIGAGADVDPTDPAATYCGVLVDEWVEVVPGDEETTGLVFHFDRPSSEAPQALLLVTPPAFTGSWEWGDLVATLHDTLDHARLRAVEPGQIDASPLARYLPAILSSVTVYPITAALNFGFNNNVALLMKEADL